MDKVVQTCWGGYEHDYSLVITGEAGLVPVLLVENRSMPQGGMEDVCRVVVTMNDPMSREFSLHECHMILRS